eukprot:gb/GEZN01016339.1/.p1 GENE.gb/GEZN01016339.1/~~gb/GEZN01016339.1/.p1  ORF type:complete len:186 (+),score=12.33 gb/GEZN01016339.1/:125-682(+)
MIYSLRMRLNSRQCASMRLNNEGFHSIAHVNKALQKKFGKKKAGSKFAGIRLEKQHHFPTNPIWEANKALREQDRGLCFILCNVRNDYSNGVTIPHCVGIDYYRKKLLDTLNSVEVDLGEEQWRALGVHEIMHIYAVTQFSAVQGMTKRQRKTKGKRERWHRISKKKTDTEHAREDTYHSYILSN